MKRLAIISFLRRFRRDIRWTVVSLLWIHFLWARDEPFSFSAASFVCILDVAPQLKSSVVQKYLEKIDSNKVDAVKNLLDSLGFFFMTCDTVGDTIYFRVGARNFIDSLRISANIPCTVDSIQKGLLPRPYDAGELAALAEKTLRFFGGKGYPFSKLSISISDTGKDARGDASKRVRSPHGCIVTFSVRENGRYCFSRPLFAGKWKTNGRLIGHDIFVKKDSVFNLRKIEESKSRLRSRSYVNSVETGPLQVIDDRERTRVRSDYSGSVQVPFIISDNAGMGIDGAIAFAAGGANAHDLSGIFNISLLNLFRRGETGRLSYRGEQDYQRLEVSIELPYIFNVPLFSSTGFGMEIKENDYGYLHGKIKLTTDLRPFWQWGIAVKGHEVTDSAGYSTQFEGIDFVVSEEPKPYRAGESSGEADFKIGSGIVQYSGRQLTRWHIDMIAGLHWPFSFRHAAVGRVVFGTLATDVRDTLQAVELYRTGGYKSLRGYSDNEFAFRTIVYEQIEYHLYFSYSGSIFIFMDCGMGFNRDARLSIPNAVKLLGYGAGVRIPVKIGDASIEWARNYLETSGWGRIHFAISNTLAAGNH